MFLYYSYCPYQREEGKLNLPSIELPFESRYRKQSKPEVEEKYEEKEKKKVRYEVKIRKLLRILVGYEIFNCFLLK